jgi:hypothetical protein
VEERGGAGERFHFKWFNFKIVVLFFKPFNFLKSRSISNFGEQPWVRFDETRKPASVASGSG